MYMQISCMLRSTSVPMVAGIFEAIYLTFFVISIHCHATPFACAVSPPQKRARLDLLKGKGELFNFIFF